jgi:hypothetical protein
MAVFEPASTRASLVITADPHYIDSARTEQNAPLPTALVLLRERLLWQSLDGYELLLSNECVCRAVP